MTNSTKRLKTSTQHKDETGHYLFEMRKDGKVDCLDCEGVFLHDD